MSEGIDVKADVFLAEQANNAVVVLKALALTYPAGNPDATILEAAATITASRVRQLLGKESQERQPALTLVHVEGVS